MLSEYKYTHSKSSYTIKKNVKEYPLRKDSTGTVRYGTFYFVISYIPSWPISIPERFNRYGTVWYAFFCSQKIFLRLNKKYLLGTK